MQSKRIVIATAGSQGDIEPFSALGHGLRARGHAVHVSSHAFHRAHFEQHGFEFHGHTASMTQTRLTEVLEEMVEQGPMDQLQTLMQRFFLCEGPGQLEHQLNVMSGADLVIVHWLDAIGQGAAEQLGIPWVSVILTPGSLPSASRPPGPLPHLGRRWARFWWHAADQMVEPVRVVIDQHLRDLGLRRANRRLLAPPSPYLNLVAASPSLLNTPSDWPSTVRITGDWAPIGADAGSGFPCRAQLGRGLSPGLSRGDTAASSLSAFSPALDRFVRQHPNPVVIAFGSLGGVRRQETLALARTVAADAATPVILTSPDLDVSGGPENLFVTGYVPYAALFGHASCVVHHAGAGTSMLVVRAGVPSFPVPHLIDNAYWADRLHRRGVATKPVPRRHLTATRLREGIREARTRASLRTQAAALSALVQQEDGVAYAVKLVEHFLESSTANKTPV
ncbi:MAG: glycosyltransferase family 1 protein [Deltaproteobacteria bacterium]|nr:glycosyltransferase family 1 protein [Deltaproteobacteria bacterium]